jgi:protein-disulfide isomerase
MRHHAGVSSPPKQTKQERREAARQAREEAERAATAGAARKRRLALLGGVLAVAAVLVVVAIVVSGGGGSSGDADSRASKVVKAQGPIPGQKEASEMLAGVKQDGIFLGDPKAPVRFVEFADLQCPFCREYALNTMPVLVQDYVRAGKVRMEFRDLAFIGKDSQLAGRWAAAAAQQGRLWNFSDVFYFNQGEENTGYVNEAFLTKIARAAGVDPVKAKAYAATSAAGAPIAAATTLAQRFGVSSTPSFLVGRSGGGLAKVDAGPTDTEKLKAAIDSQLKGGT